MNTLIDNHMSPHELLKAWENLRQDNPHLRIREAAARLQVSEAELLATHCGISVTRLSGDWLTLLRELAALGPLMALTRNNDVVHENTGLYETVNQYGPFVVVNGNGLSLCLQLQKWAMGFAVEEESQIGIRHSFQFFDCSGQAVHKIYLTETEFLPQFGALTSAFRADDQTAEQAVQALSTSELISFEGLPEPWQRLLSCSKGASGCQTRVKTQNSSLFWELLHQIAQLKLPIQIVVSNYGASQLHSGVIDNLKVAGPWLNILDPRFNLHLNETALVDLSVVSSVFNNQALTTLKLFNQKGECFINIFGDYDDDHGEDLVWWDLVTNLPTQA